MIKSSSVKIMTKKDFYSFVDNLIKNSKQQVVGVKAKGKHFVYAPLEKADELRLDFDVTILPPKKYFLPQYDEVLSFKLSDSLNVEESKDTKAPIIIGVHPYDIIALNQTDAVYLDPQQDLIYKKRRKEAVIIGVDIVNVSERSFAASMNTHVVDEGFDLLLTDLGKSIAVTIGSEKGEALLDRYGEVKDATKNDIERIERIRKELPKKYKNKVKIPKEEWASLLSANYENSIWEEKSDLCLECTSCTIVCPTCFCYDVYDELTLDMKNGKRIRTWDGCMLRDFTRVGSGEVFRSEVKERYRHRFYRKGNYLPSRYGFVACVGCGRCGTACLPDIADPCKLINQLSIFGGADKPDRFYIKTSLLSYPESSLHTPRPATIKKITRLTGSETLFEIELDDHKPLGHEPGQFVEVSILGVGEAPFCVSSPPSRDAVFEIAVRRVGNVTSKLFTMKPGDKIGVRGPFGHGFNTESMKGKHLLFVAGGIGIFPLRSLIKHVLDPANRDDYKSVTILYGCKKPCEVLFMDEVKKWEKSKDVTCKLTVDKCEKDECWAGEIGLITTLFPKIKLDKADSKNTIAVICGPPVMYKYVIRCLQTLGIPDENIVVSLERRMKCGVGKCGHCQINGVYTCKEGPVFNYNDIKNLPEAFE